MSSVFLGLFCLLLQSALSAQSAPIVDVVVPEEGDVIGLKENLDVNIFIDGIAIPSEGYAIAWVNKREIGRFESNQFTLRRPNPLRVGRHVLTVRVYNNEDQEIEEAAVQKHFSVEDIPSRDDQHEEFGIAEHGECSNHQSPMSFSRSNGRGHSGRIQIDCFW